MRDASSDHDELTEVTQDELDQERATDEGMPENPADAASAAGPSARKRTSFFERLRSRWSKRS